MQHRKKYNINEGVTPKITISGINTRNSSKELINADNAELNVNISRGYRSLSQDWLFQQWNT